MIRSAQIAAVLVLCWQAAAAVCVEDDSGTRVCLDAPPERLVSLYGAYTEVLWELGLGGRLVGRTTSDDTVQQLLALPTVGSGLRPDVEFLLALRPDLVVSRAGRAAGDAVASLRARGLTVAAFDPRSLADLYGVFRRLGVLTGATPAATRLRRAVEEQLARVAVRSAGADPIALVYEVRQTPLTVAGRGGLLDELIEIAGGRNAVGADKKLLLFDLEALLKLDPEAYLVQEGPMNRNPTPPAERPVFPTLRAVRAGRVLQVDERLFSRPGPRVAEAAEQLSRFLHPARWQGAE